MTAPGKQGGKRGVLLGANKHTCQLTACAGDRGQAVLDVPGLLVRHAVFDAGGHVAIGVIAVAVAPGSGRRVWADAARPRGRIAIAPHAALGQQVAEGIAIGHGPIRSRKPDRSVCSSVWHLLREAGLSG